MLSAGKNLILDIYDRFTRDDGFALAGNVAFCALLAFFPFLIFLTTLAGFFGNEQLAQTAVDYLLSVAPKELVSTLSEDITQILTVPDASLLTVSVIFMLYTAAGGVESVRTALNRAYGYTETRIWPFRFIQNVSFVICGAFILMSLSLLVIFVPLFWAKAHAAFPNLLDVSPWFHLLRMPVSLFLLFAGLLMAHLFLPVKRHPIREILPGIILTMIFWLMAAWIYAEYLRHFSRLQLMYAGLANVIIALIFMYISALFLILGGAINQALITARERASE